MSVVCCWWLSCVNGWCCWLQRVVVGCLLCAVVVFCLVFVVCLVSDCSCLLLCGFLAVGCGALFVDCCCLSVVAVVSVCSLLFAVRCDCLLFVGCLFGNA